MIQQYRCDSSAQRLVPPSSIPAAARKLYESLTIQRLAIRNMCPNCGISSGIRSFRSVRIFRIIMTVSHRVNNTLKVTPIPFDIFYTMGGGSAIVSNGARSNGARYVYPPHQPMVEELIFRDMSSLPAPHSD
ncbi:hypothetical protein APHAL10511_003193 [Amanita phalloides]|nr:hypothetical protein APHAL10511_003193 [Amanita phalloides]